MDARHARHVQHLRLRCEQASHTVQVPRVVDRIAEALRCASLPDAPGRLLLVRRLALGRLPPAGHAVALTLHLEAAVQRAGWVWVRGDTAAAAHAPAVWFAHTAHAVATAWAWRKAGHVLDAWYWRSALPGVALNASRPALRQGLRALLDRQVGAGAASAWWPEGAVEPEEHGPAPRSGADMPAAPVRGGAAPPRSPTAASREPGASAPATATTRHPEPIGAVRTADGAAATSKATASPGTVATPPASPPLSTAPAARTGQPFTVPAHRDRARAPSAGPAIDSEAPSHRAALHRLLSAPPARFGPPQPTQVGGLLLLLPALQAIGWHGTERGAADFAALAVAALERLRPPIDDPVHPLLADLADGTPLAPRQADARTTWRTLRHWLREHAGIGPAHLLWRPAALRWDSTHIDLHFALRDADLRVRRAGLDLSPGWLPWLGRVVNIHFDAQGLPR